MSKKNIFIGLATLLLVFAGMSLTNWKNKASTVGETHKFGLLTEEWVPFTNTVNRFTFMHPKSLEVGSDSGDGYPPGTLNSVVVLDSNTRLFSVERNYSNEKNIKNLSLKEFAERIRKVQMMNASTSPDKQDEPPQQIIVAGLLAYQFTHMGGTRPTDGAVSLGLWGPAAGSISDTYRLVLVEDTQGVKFFIRYIPENSISQKIFDSFAFTD